MECEIRVLIVGDWHSELHEEALFVAFSELGNTTIRFPWNQYFKTNGKRTTPLALSLKLQNKFLFGPRFEALNADLVRVVQSEQPDIVFVYRGTHIKPGTLQGMRDVCPTATFVGYNNDDPFGPGYPWWVWRHHLRGVPFYDLVLAYRQRNIEEYRLAGAKQSRLLRSWFMPHRNFPVGLTQSEQDRYGSDVVFVGHYEDDGRLQYLEEVVRRGWRLRIFGPGYEWDNVLRRSRLLASHAPVSLVWGRDYNLALCGARVALCFLSKLNRDTYTRRCFEIPACRTVLMSEFSEDLAGLYQENKEAVFFKGLNDFGRKLDWLLSDVLECDAVAGRGLARVWRDQHHVTARARDVMAWIKELKD